MEKSITDSKKMTAIAYQALEEKKGEDIKILEIREISVLADYFVIASGNNQSQIQAMVDEVKEKLEEAGCYIRRLEGNRNSSWILMDYGDLVIHIFDKEDRLFYDLERIWSDGRQINPKDFDKHLFDK